MEGRGPGPPRQGRRASGTGPGCRGRGLRGPAGSASRSLGGAWSAQSPGWGGAGRPGLCLQTSHGSVCPASLCRSREPLLGPPSPPPPTASATLTGRGGAGVALPGEPGVPQVGARVEREAGRGGLAKTRAGGRGGGSGRERGGHRAGTAAPGPGSHGPRPSTARTRGLRCGAGRRARPRQPGGRCPVSGVRCRGQRDGEPGGWGSWSP